MFHTHYFNVNSYFYGISYFLGYLVIYLRNYSRVSQYLVFVIQIIYISTTMFLGIATPLLPSLFQAKQILEESGVEDEADIKIEEPDPHYMKSVYRSDFVDDGKNALQ